MKFFLTLTALLFSSLLLAQYEVGSKAVTYNDPDRAGRQVESAVYYPATTSGEDANIADGDFPVIVFGHGFVMSWDAYENIWEELVPKGYIMVFAKTESGFSPSHETFGQDLSFLVNQMQAENLDPDSVFYEHVTNKSAIMGHSMGGGATFLAAANNTSIETIVGLAPAETNPSAAEAAAKVGVPALVFHGSADGVTLATEHASLLYDGLTTACRNFISITGGAHCYYANSSFTCDFGEGTSSTGISIEREEQHQILFNYLTKWFDYTLRSNCAALSEFDSLLATDSRVTFQDDCDATSLLNTVTLDETVLTADQDGATYQWIDCNNSNAPILGATTKVYTAVSNGSFAVEITKDGCTVTSECVDITSLSTPDFNKSTVINIYPNPSKGTFNIKLLEPALLSVYNLMGKQVYKTTANSGVNKVQLKLASGAYIISVKTEDGRLSNRKLIIE